MAGGRFTTTQWSLVSAAGDSRNPAFREAVAALCQQYWYPIYAYVRRQGVDPDRAQDLTQGFFVSLLERRTVKAADPQRGRFRSFLLSALRFYLADERDRDRAWKRGGRTTTLSLDVAEAEAQYRLEGDLEQTPERLFAKRWALRMLEVVRARLDRELDESAEPDRSRRLARFLTDEAPTLTYRQLASELSMTEGAVKVAVHRLRRRFGDLLREEVARTVSDPVDVDEELRLLQAALTE